MTGSGTYQTYDTVNIEVNAAEGCRYVKMASGKHNIPFSFLALGQSYTDTVLLERITGDTVGYCFDYFVEDQPYGEGGTLEWGIRVPSVMRQDKQLTAVQLYYLAEGNYTLTIYEDETLNNATPVYSHTYYLEGWQGWRTLQLENVLSFAPGQTVWIILSFNDTTGWDSPIAASPYCGNPDGSWYRFNGSSNGWDIYHPISGYYTWMVRAVLVGEDGIEENADGAPAPFAFISNGNLIVKGEGILQVIDALGRPLPTKELPTSNLQLPTSSLPAGVYVLRLINGENVKTQKIVVK